jgi:hypothetical protein
MTDREGNTGAPKVDEREVRSNRGSGYAPLEEERGTSWVSVVLGCGPESGTDTGNQRPSIQRGV